MEELQSLIVEAVLEKKAVDVLVLDIRSRADFTDCFIICSGDSRAQVQAIVDSVLEKTRGTSYKSIGVEGYSDGNWIIVDLVDIFVHVFQKQARSYYDLERLWGDVPVVEIETLANEFAR